MKLSTITIFLFFFTIQLLVAQKDNEEGRFTAALVAGVSLSQIDGDDDASYSKVGFNGGARGGVRFGDKMELCTEILFSSKGSSINHLGTVYHLDYIEVPVLFYYKDWKAVTKTNKKYMRVMLGAGLSYSRLLQSATYRNKQWENPSNTPNYVDPFLKNDLMFMFDVNFFFTRNWGVNFRWSRSILSIVDENTSLRGNPNSSSVPAFSHTVVMRLVFKF